MSEKWIRKKIFLSDAIVTIWLYYYLRKVNGWMAETLFSSDVCLSVCLSVRNGPVNLTSWTLNPNSSKTAKPQTSKFVWYLETNLLLRLYNHAKPSAKRSWPERAICMPCQVRRIRTTVSSELYLRSLRPEYNPRHCIGCRYVYWPLACSVYILPPYVYQRTASPAWDDRASAEESLVHLSVHLHRRRLTHMPPSAS